MARNVKPPLKLGRVRKIDSDNTLIVYIVKCNDTFLVQERNTRNVGLRELVNTINAISRNSEINVGIDGIKMSVRGRIVFEEHINVSACNLIPIREENIMMNLISNTVVQVLKSVTVFKKHPTKFSIPPVLAYYCADLYILYNSMLDYCPYDFSKYPDMNIGGGGPLYIWHRLRKAAYEAGVAEHNTLLNMSKQVCLFYGRLHKTKLEIPLNVVKYINS